MLTAKIPVTICNRDPGSATADGGDAACGTLCRDGRGEM